MINREVLNDAVQAMLIQATGKEVGLSDPPSKTPTVPYAILYPLFTAGSDGDWADGTNITEWVFQVTCVGGTPKQCGWMSSRISHAFLQKGPGGGYTYGLPETSELRAWGRSCDGLGGILQSGDDLYTCADTYRLRIEEK